MGLNVRLFMHIGAGKILYQRFKKFDKMTAFRNKSLLLFKRMFFRDVCKVTAVSRTSLFENKSLNSPIQLFDKRKFTTSTYLKCETNIVKSFCRDVEIPQDVSFFDFIWKKSVELHGKKTALVNGITGTSYTYEEAQDISTKFRNGLRKWGFDKGDVFAVYLPNCPEYILSLTGAIGAGGVVTTINPTYKATEVARQLDMSGASFIFTKSSMFQTAQEAVKMCNKQIQIILLDKRTSGICYEDIIKEGSKEWRQEVSKANNNSDVCLLPCSSGTTGLPKGVMLTAQNVISNICQQVHGKEINFIEETTDDYQPKTICVLPMFHIYGLAVTSLSTLHAGGQVITLPSFDPTTFLNAMEKYKPTFMHFAPPLVDFCANHPKVEPKLLEPIKYIMVGAAPVGETLIEEFKKKAPNVHFRELYGMTELSPLVTLTIVDLYKPGSCGVLLPNTEAKVLDLETGNAVGPNQTGEVCFKGPQVMKGYLNNEKATSDTIRDGWLHSGDIAFYDDMKRIYIVDRLKELIKVKGFQVPPAELENLIRSHPLAADVAVIGIPDKIKGEIPRAYIVLKADTKESKEECSNQINEFVDKHVAKYKRLAGGIEFVDAIPKSAAGKILRKDLKARFIDHVGLHGVHSK